MNATIFTAYGKVLQHMDKKEALSHWWAGCAAGIAQTAIISPVELIKEMVYLRIYGLSQILYLKFYLAFPIDWLYLNSIPLTENELLKHDLKFKLFDRFQDANANPGNRKMRYKELQRLASDLLTYRQTLRLQWLPNSIRYKEIDERHQKRLRLWSRHHLGACQEQS